MHSGNATDYLEKNEAMIMEINALLKNSQKIYRNPIDKNGVLNDDSIREGREMTIIIPSSYLFQNNTEDRVYVAESYNDYRKCLKWRKKNIRNRRNHLKVSNDVSAISITA